MTRIRTLLAQIVETLVARRNCLTSGNAEWAQKWTERLDSLASELPSGSGFDNGTQIDRDRSNERQVILTTSFHHMNDGGMYDGWTDHTITIIPTFLGFDIRVSGRNRNDIKDYLAECFHDALMSEAPAMAIATA